LITPISPHIRNEIFSAEPIPNPLVPEISIKEKSCRIGSEHVLFYCMYYYNGRLVTIAHA
jgi:hypothetical protein